MLTNGLAVQQNPHCKPQGKVAESWSRRVPKTSDMWYLSLPLQCQSLYLCVSGSMFAFVIAFVWKSKVI